MHSQDFLWECFSGSALLFPKKLTTFFGRRYRYVKHKYTERSNVKTAWKKLNIWQLISTTGTVVNPALAKHGLNFFRNGNGLAGPA